VADEIRLALEIASRRFRQLRTGGQLMWWGIGFGALLWFILFVWLGLRTLRNGHGWMFFFGIFFPILWIFGAFMQPANAEVY
jgi:hypothetical protein